MNEHELSSASDLEKDGFIALAEATEALEGVEVELKDKLIDTLRPTVHLVVTTEDGTDKRLLEPQYYSEVEAIVESVAEDIASEKLVQYLLQKYPSGEIPVRDISKEIGVDLTVLQLKNICMTYLGFDVGEHAFGCIGVRVEDVVEIMSLFEDGE